MKCYVNIHTDGNVFPFQAEQNNWYSQGEDLSVLIWISLSGLTAVSRKALRVSQVVGSEIVCLLRVWGTLPGLQFSHQLSCGNNTSKLPCRLLTAIKYICISLWENMMIINKDSDCLVLFGRKFNSCISVLGCSGESLRCFFQPFAMLLDWGLCVATGASAGTGLGASHRPCLLSVPLLLGSCLVLPCCKVCAMYICSFPPITKCSRGSQVCDPWCGMDEHREVTGLRENCRSWHPAFQSALLEGAWSSDAAQCLGSSMCHMTQRARCGSLHLSQHNLLFDM